MTVEAEGPADRPPIEIGSVTTPGPRATAPRAHLAAIVAVCFIVAALEGYDIQTLGVAAPALGPGLHLSLQVIGYAAAVTMAAMGVGALAGGWLADRVGRKRVLVVSVVLFGAAMVATLGVRDASALILARVCTGLGIGGAMPNIIAIAADVSPIHRRSRAITSVSVGLPAGAAACALADRLGAIGPDWRGLFLIGGLLTLPAIPLAIWLLPETRRELEGPDRSRGHPLFHLFRQGRWSASLLVWIAICLTMTMLSVMTTWLPTLMIHKGLSRDGGALAAFVFNAVGVAGGLLAGRLIDRVGFRWPLVAAFAGLAGAGTALAITSGFVVLIVGAGVAGFLVIGAQFGLYAIFPRYYPPDGRSTGSGAGVAAGRVGSVVGPSIAGLLLSHGAAPSQLLAALIPAAAGAALAAWALSVLGKPFLDGAGGGGAPL